MAREIEASVQMRLYSLSKGQFALVFVAFFICFLVSMLIGVAGPPIILSVTTNDTAVRDLKRGPFNLHSPSMTKFHQQMWLIARVHIDNTAGTKFEHPFEMSMSVQGMNGEDRTPQSAHPAVTGDYHNRTRFLKCTGECDDIILLHLGFLDFTNYVISIKFHGLDKVHYTFTAVQFYFKSYNPSFTNLEIWIRFVFLVFTFLVTSMFAHSLRKFSLRDWSIEQKWLSILLPLLLLYNDPLFPLTFLVDSWIPGALDAMFQATYLCGLLLFWLCIYHGVRQTDRRFTQFYLPKLAVVGFIYLAAVTLSSWQRYNELRDPTYIYRLNTSSFMGFKVFFFITGALYLLYLAYLLIRAYAELRSMPYFDIRLKFLTALMLIVLAISATIMSLRFGTAVLQDNFVAELSTHYGNSAEFVSFFGLLNFYMYTMAYVYSPSSNALYESHFKDNPALSMLNDSDEEVHYGSDQDDGVTTQTHRFDTEED